MEKKLKFLDCTLRDGGYYNRWDFNQKLINAYLKTMSLIGVDVVEIGFRGSLKNSYRLFNIPKNLSGNDVGSLEHVIERRLKYYDDLKTKPDLVLIDGGKSQLKFVNRVIHESDHKEIEVISIVKGSNRFRATETIIGKTGVVELDKYSKAFLLLQEIRDESHRFAIQAQRKKKSSKITKSELDSIEGIGKVKKQRLIKKFKSIKKIKLASKTDLMLVEGINEKIVMKIRENLK